MNVLSHTHLILCTQNNECSIRVLSDTQHVHLADCSIKHIDGPLRYECLLYGFEPDI